MARIESGSSTHIEVVAVCEMIRKATARYVTEARDPREALAVLMTALPNYAGTLFATLMLTGDINPQEQARAAGRRLGR